MGGGGEGGRKKKKKSKRIHRTSQNIRKINVFFFETLLSESFPTSPPWDSSNTVLICGPVVGTAQILIRSYSCVFLPPMSTAIRASAFSFVGALNGLLCTP